MARAPKDPNDRLRHESKARKQVDRPKVPKTPQPTLEAIIGDVNPVTMMPWSSATTLLWRQFATWPTTENLRPLQWTMLARAMILDDALLSGITKVMPEHRQAFSKWGVTPMDLARLRVFIAEDDTDGATDNGTGAHDGEAYAQYGHLALVESDGTDG